MAVVAQFNGARDRPRSSLAGLVAVVRSACAGCVVLACLGLGPAQPPLVWVAPSECPRAALVKAQLNQLLAESVSDAVVEASARVERLRGHSYRLQLRLSVGSHRAERTLESDSCEELAATAAWLIAVAIDPSVHDRAHSNREHEQPAPAGAAAAEAAQSEDTASSARPSADTPGRTSSRSAGTEAHEDAGHPRAGTSLSPRVGRAAALAGVSFGTAGAAQAELGAAGGLGLGWLYSELELSALLPRREELAGGGVVSSWSLALGLRECALWGARLRWGPCLTLTGLRTVGQAEGLSSSQPDQTLFWMVAGVALRAAWNLRNSLELTVAGSAGVPISPRPRFTVEGVGEVATVSALTGQLRVGLGFLTR
jgi:hypothetical protein